MTGFELGLVWEIRNGHEGVSQMTYFGALVIGFGNQQINLVPEAFVLVLYCKENSTH